MNTTRGARRIFWLVRLLGALGLAIVVVMIGQSGLQLKSIRTSRVRFQEEQSARNQASQEIFDGCPQLKDGYLYVNETPGWGIEVDEKTFEGNRIA